MAARTLVSLSSSQSLLGAPGVALVPRGFDSLSPDFLESPGSAHLQASPTEAPDYLSHPGNQQSQKSREKLVGKLDQRLPLP